MRPCPAAVTWSPPRPLSWPSPWPYSPLSPGAAAPPRHGRPPGQRNRTSSWPLFPAQGATGLYIAQQDGLFAKAGLDVTIKTVTSAVDVIPAVINGSVDIASGQYAAYIQAEASGVADMRIIAPGDANGPRLTEIMTGPHSAIRSPAQLKGKTIAVNATNSEISDLVYSMLSAYGITPSQLRLVTVPFPAMAGALAAGRVNAVFVTEPYNTEAAQKYGDQALLDSDTGPLANLPISGYAVLASWAKKYPRTARHSRRPSKPATASRTRTSANCRALS